MSYVSPLRYMLIYNLQASRPSERFALSPIFLQAASSRYSPLSCQNLPEHTLKYPPSTSRLSQPFLAPSKYMGHQFKYWICVRFRLLLAAACILFLRIGIAGIIEGANDNRGRGRQGMSTALTNPSQVFKMMASDCWYASPPLGSVHPPLSHPVARTCNLIFIVSIFHLFFFNFLIRLRCWMSLSL
jgi:hypothetical protein